MLLTEYLVERRGRATLWLCRSHADPPFIDSLAQADRWFADPAFVLVKDTLKTKVGRLKIAIGGVPSSIYVKRYNPFSLRYRIGSLFSQSAARRSLRGAEILANAGIACAQPVASVEVRSHGMLQESFFVSKEIVGARTSDKFWRENLWPRGGAAGFRLRRAYLAGLGALFATLHSHQIYHDDLKDANIMAFAAEDGIRFALLDLEGVRRCADISERRRVKNLMQLLRTLGRYLSQSQKLFLLKNYLGPAFRDRNLKRRVVGAVLELAKRVDRRKAQEALRNRR